MKSNKPTYAGRIGNAGTRHVKAPFPAEPSGKNTVKRGDDLRSGKKSGK